MNEEKKEGFEYGYSAPTAGERREIEGIRSKYMPADERQQKLERLKALDRKVKRPAVLLAAVLGVCGVLLFGLGMCMVLEWTLYLWGSLVALAGIALAARRAAVVEKSGKISRAFPQKCGKRGIFLPLPPQNT